MSHADLFICFCSYIVLELIYKKDVRFKISSSSLLCSCSNADVRSLDLSCQSNPTLFLREEIAEMEAAASKFEEEAEVIEEIQGQGENGDDLYSYPLILSPIAEEKGYSPYCNIKFELNPELPGTTEITGTTLAQSQEPAALGSHTSPAVSEGSISCIASTLCSLSEPLESLYAPNNVRFRSIL